MSNTIFLPFHMDFLEHSRPQPQRTACHLTKQIPVVISPTLQTEEDRIRGHSGGGGGFQQGGDLGLMTIPFCPATSAWSHTVLFSSSPTHRLPYPALVLMRPWSEGVDSLRDTDAKQGGSCCYQPSTSKTQKQGESLRVFCAGTISSRWGRVLRFASSCIDIKYSKDLLLERA